MARLRWVLGTVALLVLVGTAPAIAAPPGSAAPTGLRTTSVAATSVGLAWNAVPGATGYEVLRGTPTTALTVVGTSAMTAYSDTGLAAGRTYVYAVATLSKKGASAASVPLTVLTLPAAPTGLIAAAISSTSVSLSWKAPEGATGYEVWRATATNAPVRVMVLSGSTSDGITVPPPTEWTDTQVQALGTYTYTVRATNASGTSRDSVPATVTTPPPAKTATNTTLSSSENPSSAGDQVTFTAVVKAPQGTAVPSGTLTFDFGSTGATVTLNPNGVASWTTTTAAAGTFTVHASYLGSTTYAASSASLSQTVQAVTSSLLAPYVAYPTGSWPKSVVAADVNGDGRAEAVLATTFYFDTAHDYQLYVYAFVPGQAGPTVTVLPTALEYGDAAPMATADPDGDGYADVLLGTSSGVQVFRGSAAGLQSGGTPISTPGEVRDLVVAELTGDNHPDLLLATRGGPNGGALVLLLPGLGDGVFGAAQTLDTTSTVFPAVAAGDMNGDGHADVVVLDGTSLHVLTDFGLLTGGTPGNWDYSAVATLETGGWGTHSVAVGDVTGDGLGDALVTVDANTPDSALLVLPGTAHGLAPQQRLASDDVPSAVLATDLNRDGRTDVVVAHGGWNELGLYLGGPSTLGSETLFPLPYASDYPSRALAAGDVTGDGRPDVLIADYNNGLVVLRGR
jgi:hypothetical protein